MESAVTTTRKSRNYATPTAIGVFCLMLAVFPIHGSHAEGRPGGPNTAEVLAASGDDSGCGQSWAVCTSAEKTLTGPQIALDGPEETMRRLRAEAALGRTPANPVEHPPTSPLTLIYWVIACFGCLVSFQYWRAGGRH
jgi:hypothetical protein